MIKYKLTKQDLTTHQGFQWHIGVQVETNGLGTLNSSEWLHYYHDPLVAVFFNPIFGNIPSPRLWEVRARGRHIDDYGIRGACTHLTLMKEITLPDVTPTQRVAFGILFADKVCTDIAWKKWANKWLSGEDRSPETSSYASSQAAAQMSTHVAACAAALVAAQAAAKIGRAGQSSPRAARAAALAVMWSDIYSDPLDVSGVAKQAMRY